MKSEHITPKVVSSNPFMARCTHTTLSDNIVSVTCDRSVVFSWYSGFPDQYNWPPRYNWNSVESSVKHNKPNQTKPITNSDCQQFRQCQERKNNYTLPQIIKRNADHDIPRWKSRSYVGTGTNCGGVKPLNGISTHFIDSWTSNGNADINMYLINLKLLLKFEVKLNDVLVERVVT